MVTSAKKSAVRKKQEPLFIQAANFTHSDRDLVKDILFLTVHDEEYPKIEKSAINVAHFFGNQPKGNNGTSAHRTVDDKEVIHCVRLHDIAWAAPGGNTNGIHWEFAGYAKQTKSQWKDKYGLEMLDVGARDFAKVAHECKFKKSELIRLTSTEVRSYRRRGIVGHIDITHAFPNVGTHIDPGENFPWIHFLDRVRYFYGK